MNPLLGDRILALAEEAFVNPCIRDILFRFSNAMPSASLSDESRFALKIIYIITIQLQVFFSKQLE
jgi:hypothetical protein